MSADKEDRPLYFIGSSREDLKEFPEHVMRQIGHALRVAQSGGKSPNAKPFKGVSSSVLEVVTDYDGNT